MKKAPIALVCLFFLLAACGQALQRGMAGDAYISTARPNISLQAKDMPLMTAGRHMLSMDWTGVLGGLPIEVWLAVYGQGGLSPLAIAGQAQLPADWVWDYSMARPFSVDHANVVFNGATYESWTYIVPHGRDPFMEFVTSVLPGGQPQLWIARAFASRFNFNQDKIFMEYREPLPADITDLSQLPLGRDSFLRDFAARAQAAFIVGSVPLDVKAKSSYANNVQWQYMNQFFLGTVTHMEPMAWN